MCSKVLCFCLFRTLSSTLSLIPKIYLQFASIWKNLFFFFFYEEKTLPKPFLKFSIFLCLAGCVEFFLGWDTLLLKRLGKLSLSCKVDVRKKRTWRIETVKDIRAFLDFHLALFRQKRGFGNVACKNPRSNHTCLFSTGVLKDTNLVLV